jgi:hypothetical protein
VELREALTLAEADLTELVAQRDRLQADIDRVQAEVTGLRVALSRQNGQPFEPEPVDAGGLGEEVDYAPEPVEVTDEPDPIWTRLTRTDAVLRLLEEDGPLGPTEIAEMLQERGRSDETPGAVSATLAKLHSHRRVKSLGRALWVVPGGRRSDRNVVHLNRG